MNKTASFLEPFQSSRLRWPVQVEEKGIKMFIRYIQKHSGRVFGLLMGGYDLSDFTHEEMDEFYSHPTQLPSPDLAREDCIFAFKSHEAETRWSRMLELRTKAALGVVERIELLPEEFEVIWSDNDQVALIPP